METYDAVCISLVRDVPPRKAVRLLTAGHLRALGDRRRADRWIDATDDDDRYWIAVTRIGPWTALWEDNGYAGSLDPVARRMSRTSRFVSAFWNVNAVEHFIYAVHGRIVRSFDPVLELHRGGRGKRLPAEAHLPWKAHPEIAMLRLEAALTKQPAARPSWLRASDVSYWGSYG